ncbi:carbohydrate ABC transporter permease [Luteipulveratus mongoliensis]|uniref:Sugar ABC transporter permease n=1 Tax=Luteipulveratus mongoliensis TaxID=571913 RepID=A0A0K1JLF6_9MICO|nr:sugar ABC transporter permease [Luteipulveratus mongoliensis]AKU17546.1 sugar ABC transporter permease [Luteipulveratus mongoliensis]
MATTVIDDPAGMVAQARPTKKIRAGRDEHRAGWWFSAPFLVLYLLFLIGPALYGVVMSFFNSTSVRPGLGEYVGLQNYRDIFGSSDFWASMGHTLWFTVLTVPPLVVIAFVLAILTERVVRGRSFFRFIFFAPFVMPATSVTLIFTWLYASEIGLVPHWLDKLGITSPNLLGETKWAFISVAVLTIWWTVGFNFVLFLAGLQDVSRDVYEAAAIDGASPLRTMWSVTLPLLRPTIVLVTMLQILASLQIFNQMYLMTGGGPGTSTRPVMEFIYDVGFSDYRAGYAAAATMVYFAVVLIVSIIWYALQRYSRKGVRA